MAIRFGRWRRICAGGLVLAAASLALSACGNGYAYFNHASSTGDDLYFKLPSQWSLLKNEQLIRAQEPKATISQILTDESSEWQMAFFSGKTKADAKGPTFVGSQVSGLALELTLPASEATSFTTTSLRSLLLGTDPVAAAQAGGQSAFTLLLNKNISVAGLGGNRFTVQVVESKGQKFTYEQKGLLDTVHGLVYMVAVGCDVKCFAAHQAVINAVVESWSVKAGP